MTKIVKSGTVQFTLPTDAHRWNPRTNPPYPAAQQDKPITFAGDDVFADTPEVMCGLDDTGPGDGTSFVNAMAFEVSAAGFIAVLKLIDTADWTMINGQTVTCRWVAIGDKAA